jgi:cytoskeletal protein CcmA (bactofilin family)
LFKRRKPDEMPPAEPGSEPAGATLPAGLGQPAYDAVPPTADTEAEPGFEEGRMGDLDSGLGVPPFRPAAPAKEAQSMSRPPFSPGPATAAVPPQPSARPGVPPSRPPVRDPSERRTLVVGRGISVQGTVQDAERLVVEGTVEATMIHATELSIAPGGIFKGEVEVEEAEIAGTIDGTLTTRGALIVRSTGKVLGSARCRRLQVEDGGQITGRIEMITDQTRVESAKPAAAEPAV